MARRESRKVKFAGAQELNMALTIVSKQLPQKVTHGRSCNLSAGSNQTHVADDGQWWWFFVWNTTHFCLFKTAYWWFNTPFVKLAVRYFVREKYENIRKRGKAQRDDRPPLFFTDAELLWQHAKISLSWQHHMGSSMNDAISIQYSTYIKPSVLYTGPKISQKR